MNKSESKYFNTAKNIDKAFIDIISKKDIQFITVKEICEKANVNRSTFYLHYETINDLLEEVIEYIQDEFSKSFTVNGEHFANSIEESSLEHLVLINNVYLTPYLRFVKEHKSVYRAAVYNPKVMRSEEKMARLYRQILKPIFTRFGIPEDEHKYWMVYYINGVMAIVFEWLKGDCEEPIDYIVNVIEKCVRAKIRIE